MSVASTVRTVDDVFSVMESQLPKDASLIESRKFARHVTKKDKHLMNAVIDEIENLSSLMSPIAQNPDVLVRIMARTGAVLGGAQATSFFYPICDWTDVPWDIFCHSSTADDFIQSYKQSSIPEVIEDVRSDDGMRVVHMRRSIPDCSTPVNIRIFVSNMRPLESILQLRNSYEQSVISAVDAICFWPKLVSQKMYRVFESNVGTSLYPRGKTFYEMKLDPIKKTRLRKPMQTTEIYTGLESRVENVVFRNRCDINPDHYSRLINVHKNIVWAVSNSSTKYLGNIADMH